MILREIKISFVPDYFVNRSTLLVTYWAQCNYTTATDRQKCTNCLSTEWV